jgi:hypothetical protein
MSGLFSTGMDSNGAEKKVGKTVFLESPDVFV